MFSVKDISELFGRKIAKTLVILIVASAITYFAVDSYTGESISDWIRNYFQPPLAATQLIQFQAPPTLSLSGADLVVGIDIAVPLRIASKRDKTIFIDKIEVEWKTLDRFDDFERFNEIVSSFAVSEGSEQSQHVLLGQWLKKFEGGRVIGEGEFIWCFDSEKEFEDAMGKDFDGQTVRSAYLPIKINPYQEIFIRPRFQLSVLDKNGEGGFSLLCPYQEKRALLTSLIPVFFGARGLNDTWHEAVLILHTSAGILKFKQYFLTLFVGTKLYIPHPKKGDGNQETDKTTSPQSPINRSKRVNQAAPTPSPK